jgi:hypothetical protein
MIALIFSTKVLEKRTYGHVVNRNRGKNRFDISKSSRMVEFISLNSSKLGPEFINDEFIGFISISVIENHGMTKVHNIR